MLIIGITGALGSGKGTISKFLVEKKGFKHYSAREFITKEIKRKGMPVNRGSMLFVANELRKKYSPSYIAEKLFEEASQSGEDCIIESLRTVGEITSLKNKENFYLFAVYADQRIRYERISERGNETDNVSFEEFKENEKREMTNENPHKQNLAKCLSMADYVFENNGTISELYKKADIVINKIRKRT